MTTISDKISALPPLRQLINQKDFEAKKSLGQNFIFDLKLTQRIARAASPLQGTVFEIGPGPGGLTRALFLEGAEKVIAIEKDRRAIQFLEHIVTATDGHLSSAGKRCDEATNLENGQSAAKNCANLPYNIATALLLRWLTHANAFVSLTLMFQKRLQSGWSPNLVTSPMVGYPFSHNGFVR